MTLRQNGTGIGPSCAQTTGF